jgi:hypothetical protein
VHRAVVLLFDPSLRGLVEQVQRQGLLTFEHGHQPAFYAAPKRFLLRVLVRAVGQRGLVHDAQRGQPGGDLLTEHGRAVVRHQRARQAALHERLGEAVHQALRRLVQIPLQVTDQA